ncbi:hypothetical protein M885DRAFT_621935 [Pelagophyceae sp. CCMP2097]|nr:hypothetical protein M885DRAFT_621935 [Pelagophyceae sp. CCMP2097]|mmetsp:Transcript_27725/g.93152  ORF Transcript_27725/g.93152 Transcript_27725/m.93152 type:complete len:360 (+) Transcript_27725:142-1221(+)
MGGIGNFLHNKPWHPSTHANQRAVWVAEQAVEAETAKIRERQLELQREVDTQHFADQLKKGKKAPVDAPRIDFMYAAPPGLAKEDSAAAVEAAPGAHDAAALAFEASMKKRQQVKESKAMQSTLAKEAGKRAGNGGTTHAEMIARFPELAGAPLEGAYAADILLNVQPFGKVVRNVQCLRCGEWGHQASDRDCPMRDFNPHEEARKARLERAAAGEAEKAPLEKGDVDVPAQIILQQKERLVLKSVAARALDQAARCGVAPGYGKANNSYDLLDDDDEAPPPQLGDSSAEAALLSTLSTREKRALLKRLHKLDAPDEADDGARAIKRAKKDLKKAKKKAKKEKKKRKKKDSSSSSSDSD